MTPPKRRPMDSLVLLRPEIRQTSEALQHSVKKMLNEEKFAEKSSPVPLALTHTPSMCQVNRPAPIALGDRTSAVINRPSLFTADLSKGKQAEAPRKAIQADKENQGSKPEIGNPTQVATRRATRRTAA